MAEVQARSRVRPRRVISRARVQGRFHCRHRMGAAYDEATGQAPRIDAPPTSGSIRSSPPAPGEALRSRGRGLTSTSPEQRPHLGAFKRRTLRGDLQLGLEARGERVAQELAVPRPVHCALVAIDRQTQAFPKESLDRCQHTLARALGPHVDVAVVGVTDKTVPASLQFLVQIVEQDVGLSSGESGPPCGVPSSAADTSPPSIIPPANSGGSDEGCVCP